MYLALVSLGIGFFALIWLLAAFQSSVTAGLIMGGVYVLLLLLGTATYRRYKRNWEWEQGSIMREMEAIRLSQNPKPCYLNEQKGKEAAKRAAQRNRELAALTTRTWRK